MYKVYIDYYKLIAIDDFNPLPEQLGSQVFETPDQVCFLPTVKSACKMGQNVAAERMCSEIPV